MPKTSNVPGTDRPADKAAGHWLLAQLGKKVLRPGGRETTNWLLSRALGGQIDVVIQRRLKSCAGASETTPTTRS